MTRVLLGFSLVLGFVGILLVSGCASVRDTAIRSANVAGELR